MMIKRLILFLVCAWAITMAWAGEPLKKPLRFVPSDSIVVWGEDRSDFRTTALSVAPQLEERPVMIESINSKKLKQQMAEWEKVVLPSLNVLGGQIDEEGNMQVVPTAQVIKKAGTLFLQTADAHYMDVAERTSLNALMAIATPGELSFEKHVVAQALINVSGMIYATDEEGIYVNFYVNNSTHVKNSHWNFVIDQLTAMPHSGRVKLRITGLSWGQQPIKLRLRMPDWAFRRSADGLSFEMEGVRTKLPTIYVNGREEFYEMEKGYLVINRKWNSGDEVFFDFPFHMQYVHPIYKKKVQKSVAVLQRGPLAYGFNVPTDGYSHVQGSPITEEAVPNRMGHSVMKVSFDDARGMASELKAEPVMDGANYLWMNVRSE